MQMNFNEGYWIISYRISCNWVEELIFLRENISWKKLWLYVTSSFFYLIVSQILNIYSLLIFAGKIHISLY